MNNRLTNEELSNIKELEDKPPAITATDLVNDANINSLQLDEEMRRQSGLFSHYAAMTAKVQLQSDNMKMKRDITVAKIDKEIRNKAAEEGGKIDGVKMTEKLIESSVNLDVRWVKIQKEYNEAKSDHELHKGMLEALKQKRDMLIQLGVNAREEMKGDVRTKEKEAESADRKDARARALAIASGNKA